MQCVKAVVFVLVDMICCIADLKLHEARQKTETNKGRLPTVPFLILFAYRPTIGPKYREGGSR